MQALKKLITKLLRETADKIETGNCELSDTEAMDIMSVLSHQVMSKEDACIHLNLSRSRTHQAGYVESIPCERQRRASRLYCGLFGYEDVGRV